MYGKSKWMTWTVLKEFGLTVKVIAMGSTQAKYFAHKKYKGARHKSSALPYNTPTQSHAQFFFLSVEKTCWLPTEPAITRHNSGHLGDVLIITADIYRMLTVYPELD